MPDRRAVAAARPAERPAPLAARRVGAGGRTARRPRARTWGAIVGALIGGSPLLAHAQDPKATADSALDRSRAVLADTSGIGRVQEARARARTLVLRRTAPGDAGAFLRRALAAPHLAVVPETTLVLGRDVRIDSALVVAGTTYSGARVRGPLVVLGDLFLRPGAVVEGDAIAIGGAVYPSALATVRGEIRSYRDIRPTTVPLDGRSRRESTRLAVDLGPLREVPLARAFLPGTLGLRIPLYDRVQGLSLAFGPEIALDTGRVRLEPTLTYRSNLGAIDPGLRVTFEPRGGRLLELTVARTTPSNEAWIRSDLVNSATTLATGGDVRNYYRADRAEATLFRRLARGGTTLAPYVGARYERAWSVARDSIGHGVPFSVLGRDDAAEGMRRPNPGVTGGAIGSMIVGLRAEGETSRLLLDGDLRLEGAPYVQRGDPFAQATLELRAGRPLPRGHLAEAFAHAVVTVGNAVPTQRYAYLGGNGTLPTRALLDLGGDELLFGELRYTVPLLRLKLGREPRPVLGSARWIAGAAGVDRPRGFTQNVGVRLSFAFLRAEALVDPSGRGDPFFGVGLGLVR